MILSPKLGLLIDFLLGGNGWKKPIEDSFRKLDAVVQLRATSIVNSPPSSNNGDCYIVGSAPTGVFASAGANSIATYYADQTQWLFIAPQNGWQATIGGQLSTFDGSNWTALAGVVAAHPTFASVLSAAVAAATASQLSDKVSKSMGGDQRIVSHVQATSMAVGGTLGMGLYVSSGAANGHYNWEISTQNLVDGGFQIARSINPSGITYAEPFFVASKFGDILFGQRAAGLSDSNSFSFDQNTSQGAFGTNHANGSASGNSFAWFGYNASVIGSITQSGTTGVSYNTTSDYRLKRNPKPLQGSGAFIDALKPTAWEWSRDGRADAGFLAHEFQEVCPNAVNGVKDEMETQAYEIEPAMPAIVDEGGKELTPAVPAVMGERIVPKYQSMQASSSEVIAHLVAELQSLRQRLVAAGIA